jgi:hypothetical protein
MKIFSFFLSFFFFCFCFNRAIALMMEAVSSSEMSVNFYQTVQHNIPEDSHLLPAACLVTSHDHCVAGLSQELT